MITKEEKKVAEISGKIKTMEIRGALNIAIAAASAMKYVVDESKTEDMNELILNLKSAGEKLKSARPTAVSLPNAVNYIMHLAKSGKNDDKIKLSCKIQKFMDNQENSLKKSPKSACI